MRPESPGRPRRAVANSERGWSSANATRGSDGERLAEIPGRDESGSEPPQMEGAGFEGPTSRFLVRAVSFKQLRTLGSQRNLNPHLEAPETESSIRNPEPPGAGVTVLQSRSERMELSPVSQGPWVAKHHCPCSVRPLQVFLTRSR